VTEAMSESNVNGEASMAPTKNPGKLNTSFWEQQAAASDGKPRPKKKTKHKKKKSKSSMASMWEDKLAKQRAEVAATSFPKSTTSTPPTSPPLRTSSSGSSEKISTENADPNRSPPSKPSKAKGSTVSALAGKLNMNAMMGLKGGIPPSLRKKREERKEDATELSGPQFARPLIPSTARRPKNLTKKNIVDITHNEIAQRLRTYLSESFQYDARMIMDEVVLCQYLRDIAGIDLSVVGDMQWDYDTLLDATKEVFGVQAISTWGYTLRVM